MSWVDDDGNVAWPDQCVSAADVAEAEAETHVWNRIEGWLLRIGDGRIAVPFDEMDRTKAVPIADWLAQHLGLAEQAWPDEIEAARRRELANAEKRLAQLTDHVASLRSKS